MAFTRTWSIISPADTDYAKYGARDIRYFRVDIQERVGVEHSFAGDASDGVHNQGSARIYRQSSAPTDTLAGRVWFDTTNDLLKIADGASYITPTWASGNIKDSAVTTTKIASLAVTNAKIADLAVSTGKIQDLAVTEAKIGAGAVTVNKLGASAVETAKIKNANVTLAKLATDATAKMYRMFGCSVYRTSSNQTCPTGTTLLEWNAENFDLNTMHDNTTNPSRIITPVSGYAYAKVGAHFNLAYSIPDGDNLDVEIYIRQGGSIQFSPSVTFLYSNSSGTLVTGVISCHFPSRVVALSGSTYFEVVVIKTGTGTAYLPNNAYGFFQVELVPTAA
ncbi:MAG: hypothetical protein ACWGQW_00980 [bacterium]